MAVAIEAFTVVLRRSAMEPIGDLMTFRGLVPNSTFCYDDELARCAFLDRSDALDWIDCLAQHGLDVGDSSNPDVVLVNGFDRSVTPDCDWLELARYKESSIAWLTGSEPDTVAAPRGWNPEAKVQWEPMTEAAAARRLTFQRSDGRHCVFWDSESEREVIVGRAGLPLDSMQQEAKQWVLRHLRQPGEPASLDAHDATFQRMVDMLQVYCQRRENDWTGHWLLGKAWHAANNQRRAYESLCRARRYHDGEPVIRELAGICLELGETAEAVKLAESAVAHDPSSGELWGNLALAYLLDGRLEQARKAAESAAGQSPHDRVNRSLLETVRQVQANRIPVPRRLSDL